jgi:transcriptional regulator with XRE-family HTH domain
MPKSATKPPISPSAAEFGARVRKRRVELGYTQESLAASCELHWTYIGQVERGQCNITLHNILRVSRALEIDPGILLTGLK